MKKISLIVFLIFGTSPLFAANMKNLEIMLDTVLEAQCEKSFPTFCLDENLELVDFHRSSRFGDLLEDTARSVVPVVMFAWPGTGTGGFRYDFDFLTLYFHIPEHVNSSDELIPAEDKVCHLEIKSQTKKDSDNMTLHWAHSDDCSALSFNYDRFDHEVSTLLKKNKWDLENTPTNERSDLRSF